MIPPRLLTCVRMYATYFMSHVTSFALARGGTSHRTDDAQSVHGGDAQSRPGCTISVKSIFVFTQLTHHSLRPQIHSIANWSKRSIAQINSAVNGESEAYIDGVGLSDVSYPLTTSCCDMTKPVDRHWHCQCAAATLHFTTAARSVVQGKEHTCHVFPCRGQC